MSTSFASRSAAASSDSPRRASTSATEAASGSAKREAVTSLGMVLGSSAGQHAVERGPGLGAVEAAPARREVLVGPQQKSRAGRRVEAGREQAGVVDQILTDDRERDAG